MTGHEIPGSEPLGLFAGLPENQMCGIAGMFASDGAPVDRELLALMNAATVAGNGHLHPWADVAS